ncbi:alpha-1,4 glucan phosphorylase L-2 isozyme, chloroplastic/amyloplastic [Tanacetum coccineum]
MIMKFIIDVVATVNHDPDIGDLLKVVFVPDCNVTVAEVMFPRSDLSQHIRYDKKLERITFFLFGAEAYEIAGLRKERSKGKPMTLEQMMVEEDSEDEVDNDVANL